jgi:hypothetical protein
MRKIAAYHEILEPAVSVQGDQFWLNSQLYANPAFLTVGVLVAIARTERLAFEVEADVVALELEAVVVFAVVAATELTVTVLVKVAVTIFVVVVGTQDVARRSKP